MNVIQTKHLHKQFGNFEAVKGLDLEIPEGVICGFLGPNGSGKTTTIRMLLGLSQPTEGEIFIFEQSLKQHKVEILSQVGALVDSPSFYDHLTGYENLKMMQLIHQNSSERIEEVLEIVELTYAKDKKVSDYSLGMKQRLGIAIALMNHPKLILLDEPTNGLDPDGIKKMRQLLLKLAKEDGISIVVSSHNLFEIEQMCSYVCLINKGQLLYQGDIKYLHEQYHNHSVYFKTDDNDRVLTVLSEYHPRIEADDVVIQVAYEEIPKINELLVTQNIGVFNIHQNESSLEDIFLKLTREESDALE
ncbi:ABC transporter ATP-binding protein [Staphylococcus canis]|uniref:ABC transporter ATP-binding protein n=1 Tax=Staphylococcus canis TaxID=2724942 RepID=A0ABS0T8K2_9STAP|nr:ABC transporter ATP-binding protein [Staphylococcus canis]MBI5975070.1 ABC transporter ATP-binding protein [Staphylococcus canis]